ncbi:MAG: DUF2007 domain-containing protein [Candidatus Omnitrophota bacterium]|jgi:hypothetical protein
MGNLVKIATYLDRLNAESAKNFLETQGIESILGFDDASGMRPELTMAQGVRLWVDEKDEAEARRLIAEVERTPLPSEAAAQENDADAPRGFLTWIRKLIRG